MAAKKHITQFETIVSECQAMVFRTAMGAKMEEGKEMLVINAMAVALQMKVKAPIS